MINPTNDIGDYEGSSYGTKDNNAHLNHIPHDRDLLHHVEPVDKTKEIILDLHFTW